MGKSPTIKEVIRKLDKEIEATKDANTASRLEELKNDTFNIAQKIITGDKTKSGAGFSPKWEDLTLDHPKFNEQPTNECIELLKLACTPQIISQDVKIKLDDEEFLLEKGDEIKLQVINEIIRRVKGGWKVFSHKKGKDGERKSLSRVYKSKAQAHKRLGQIEYFKNKKNK